MSDGHRRGDGIRGCSLGVLALVGITACGGGGDSALSSNDPTYTNGVFNASSTYAGRCAAPRANSSDTSGSTTWENFWLRSWTHEFYLWYSEVPDVNPANYSSTDTFFDVMKTTAVTSSGKDKDQFHFTYDTAEWEALSQSGESAGYGATWVVTSSLPPRNVVVAYLQPGQTPASAVNIARGETIIAVDGVSIDINTQAGVDVLNAGLFPGANETHSFVVQALNGQQRTVSMTSANITETPVLNYANPGVISTNSGNVGYLVFNDHYAPAESQLIQAMSTLQQANVTDLVLDLRYNGGGYLSIASEMAYMIAGNARTSGRTFERLIFNSQYSTTLNPVTQETNSPVPFYSTARGFSTTTGTPLPTLNLDRVFVITGTSTCSASESIINGLRGVGVEVIQIGSTTCGKPYGFYPEDNCGTTYFSIQFQGVNDINFGDYGDGFTPNNSSNASTARLPGCSIADDFNHSLGDSSEGRLAAALYYRTNQTCSTGPTGSGGRTQVQSTDTNPDMDGELHKGAWRENRILQR